MLLSEVRNGEQKEQKYFLYSEIFYGVQKLHKYSSSLRVRGASLLTCSFVGELSNSREIKCENKPFIVIILILKRLLF